MGVTEETLQLVFDVKNMDEAKALEAQLGRTGTTTRKLAEATDEATKKTANMGQTMLQSGRFLQDFAQGGIGGVLNNVEGLTVALGLGSGLAGVLTMVGVAAALVGPKLIDFAKSIGDGSNAVPKAADALKGLDEELKGVNKELDDLKAKTSLTSTELGRFNDLTAASVRLEKEKTAEMEKQAQLKKLMELKPKAETEEAQKRAEDLSEVVPPDQDKLIHGIEAALPKDDKARLEAQLKQQLAEAAKNIGEDPFDLGGVQKVLEARAEALRKAIQEQNKKLAEEAQDLARKAVVGGDAKATERIDALMKQRPELFPEKQRRAFDRNTPEGMRREKDGQAEADRLNAEEDQMGKGGKIDEELENIAHGKKGIVPIVHGDGGGGGGGGGHGGGGRAAAGGGNGRAGGDGAAPAFDPAIDGMPGDLPLGVTPNDLGRRPPGNQAPRRKMNALQTRAARAKAFKERQEREAMRKSFANADRPRRRARLAPGDNGNGALDGEVNDHARAQGPRPGQGLRPGGPDPMAQLVPALHGQIKAGQQGLQLDAQLVGLVGQLNAEATRTGASLSQLWQAVQQIQREAQTRQRTGLARGR